MSTYKIIKIADMQSLYHPEVGVIPEDEGNRDYQAYLVWVAEGNTAEEWSPNGD